MDRGKYGVAAGDRFYHGDTSQYQGIETAECLSYPVDPSPGMPGYVSILLWKTGMFNSQFGLLNQWMSRLGMEPGEMAWK